MDDASPTPNRRPSFQFYPGDWLNDTALKLCSLTSRGLWADMLCLMHFGRPYGHLVTPAGVPIKPQQLAALTGATAEQVTTSLSELSEGGVFSLTPDGVLFSRRMVRDEQVRNARAAGGHLGASHGHKGKEHGAKGAQHGSKGGRPRGSGGRE